MNELEQIVQRMIDAGETEGNIKLVIQNYNKVPASLAADYNVFGSDINISEQEVSDIISQAEAEPVTKIKEEEIEQSLFNPYAKGYGSYVAPRKKVEYKSYVFDEFLNEERDNIEQAKQQWISKQRKDLLKEKLEERLEDVEDKFLPWYSLPGTDPSLYAKKAAYAKKRAILATEFKAKEAEANKEYIELSNKLTTDKDSIDNIDLRIDNIKKQYDLNPDSFTEEKIKEFKDLINTREAAVDLFNEELENLNKIGIQSEDFNTIADMTQRTYNNIDVATNRISSRTLSAIAGLGDFAQNISLPGVIRNLGGIDVENEEDIKTLPVFIQPIARQMGKTMKEEKISINELRDKAEEINKFTKHRQEFKKINSLEDFGEFTLDLFSEQLVNTAVTATTGNFGLFVVSASAAGDKMNEMNIDIEKYLQTGGKEGQMVSPIQFYTAGIGYGLSEYVTEKIALKQFNTAKNSFKKAIDLDDFGEYSLKEFSLIDAAKRYGVNVNQEGSAELFASLGQNFLDKYILDKEVDLRDNLLESYVSGAVMSGLGFQAPVITNDIYRSFSTNNEWSTVNNNSKKIVELQESLKNLYKKNVKDPKVKDAIKLHVEQINDLLKENLRAKKISENRIDDLSSDDKGVLIHLTSEAYKHKKRIDKINSNENLTEDQKKYLIIKHVDKLENIYSKQEQIRNSATFSKDKERNKKATIEYATLTGVKIENITIKEGDNAIDKISEYIDSSNIADDLKKEFKEEIKVELEKNPNVHGAHFGKDFGLPISVQFESNATKDISGNSTVFSHELGHGTLFRALVEQNADIVKMSQNLEKYVKARFSKLYSKFAKTHRLYKGYDAEYRAEETLAMTIDFMRQYNIDADKSLQGKLIDNFNGLFNKNKNLTKTNEIKTGKDVFDLLKSFAFGFETGEISDLAAKVIKGEADIIKAPKVKVKEKQPVPFSKAASDNVQRIYEEQGVGGVFDIINEFKPIVNRIVDKRKDAPGFDRQLLTDEIETGERGILDLIGEYKPESGVPLAAFINKFLPARAIEASRRVLGEEFTVDVTEAKTVAAEEVAEVEVEAKPKKKKIILSDRLGVKDKVDEAINKKLPELNIENLNFKNLKDQTPEITGGLFGISPKKLISLANITKKELQSAQMFINKNADVLIAMLPEGATTGGTATGIPNTLLKAFYTKTERAKAAKTGSKAGLAIQQKKAITKKEFLETFGIINGKPDRTDRNTSARVLALAGVTGKMMSNQAIREELSKNTTEDNAKLMLRLSDGKSTVMFSKQESIDKGVPFIVDYLKQVDSEITEDKAYQILGNYANLTDNEFKSNFPIYFNGIIDYVEDMSQFIADGGKEAQQFTKAIKGVNFGNEKLNDYLKNGFWTLSDAKFKKDKKAMAWFLKTSHDLADQIILPKNMTDGNRRLILGFFAGHYNIVGSDMAKVGSTLKQGIINRLNKKGKSVLSKKTLDRWKNFDFESLKSSYASTFYTGLKKIYNANTLKEQIDIAKQYFTGKESALQIEFYDLWNTTLEEWLHSSEIGSNEFNNKADYILKLKKANAAIGTTGERIMAPGGYVYLPGSILDATIKFEHLKSSSQQSKESALLIINNEWQKNGKDNVKDYKGIYGPLELFNMIDAATGKVNDKNIFRLAGNLEAAKKIYKIDDFKTTLYDDIVSNLTKDQLKTLETASNTKETNRLNKAIMLSRSSKNKPKGITVLDFDDTLATTESLVKFTTPEGEIGTLNAEQYASTYQDLLDQGYTFDFSDFNKVVKGKLAPLFQKALKLQNKFGPENMFVLTARPPQAAQAIFDFLTANGLNIPLENITGLANSTSEAKALWIADKVGEGYNDFYFADDALQNVQAVKNMLDQFDVKSKVQQAKVKFSKDASDQFNDILEDVTGIASEKRFSATKARKRGASKGKFRFFIPPSHEDFVGLIYNFIGKGRQGDAHRDFFENALIRPLNRAYRELNTARQSIANDYKNLNKQFPDVKKKLTKKTPDGDFTYQDAIRVYLWDKHGYEIAGLSETDQKDLVDLVKSDGKLQAYADAINVISKRDDYVSPTETWEAGDLRTDLDDATGRIGREQFFTEFFENADIIFSPENMNKIEAAYGAEMVDALKDMLYRTKTGRNRPSGQNKQVNQFMNWLNGSVAATMFFNIRSAVLQQMSLVNFINFADNNILAAAKAFANQKQYWADWAMLFNSDFMKQRRGGIMTDVNGAELAASVRDAKNPAQAVIKKLLEIGFLPTQIGDNIAIATGGAPFYRNRVNSYLKEGLSQKEAESKAFVDFQVLAEATQQSARPDMVSQQQASLID
jgi:hypothetical protein